MRKRALVRAERDSYTGLALFRVEQIPTSMAPEAVPRCVDASVAWHQAMETAMEEFGYDTKEEREFMDEQLEAAEFARYCIHIDSQTEESAAYREIFDDFEPETLQFTRVFRRYDPTKGSVPHSARKSGASYDHVGYQAAIWKSWPRVHLATFDVTGATQFLLDLREIKGTLTLSQESHRAYIRRTRKDGDYSAKRASEFVGMYCNASFDVNLARAKKKSVLARSPQKPCGRSPCLEQARPRLFKSNKFMTTF